VVRRILGEYPIDLRLYNLVASGNAIGMAGRPIISAQDELEMAKRAAGGGTAASISSDRAGPSGRGLEATTATEARRRGRLCL